MSKQINQLRKIPDLKFTQLLPNQYLYFLGCLLYIYPKTASTENKFMKVHLCDKCGRVPHPI